MFVKEVPNTKTYTMYQFNFLCAKLYWLQWFGSGSKKFDESESESMTIKSKNKHILKVTKINSEPKYIYSNPIHWIIEYMYKANWKKCYAVRMWVMNKSS